MWHLLLLGGLLIGRIMPGLSPLVLRYFGKVRLCHAGESVPVTREKVRPSVRRYRLGLGAVCLHAPVPFKGASNDPQRCKIPISVDIVYSSGGNCFGGSGAVCFPLRI